MDTIHWIIKLLLVFVTNLKDSFLKVWLVNVLWILLLQMSRSDDDDWSKLVWQIIRILSRWSFWILNPHSWLKVKNRKCCNGFSTLLCIEHKCIIYKCTILKETQHMYKLSIWIRHVSIQQGCLQVFSDKNKCTYIWT